MIIILWKLEFFDIITKYVDISTNEGKAKAYTGKDTWGISMRVAVL